MRGNPHDDYLGFGLLERMALSVACKSGCGSPVASIKPRRAVQNRRVGRLKQQWRLRVCIGQLWLGFCDGNVALSSHRLRTNYLVL